MRGTVALLSFPNHVSGEECSRDSRSAKTCPLHNWRATGGVGISTTDESKPKREIPYGSSPSRRKPKAILFHRFQAVISKKSFWRVGLDVDPACFSSMNRPKEWMLAREKMS